MSVLRRRGGAFGLGIVDRILPKKGADGGKGGGTSSDVQSRLSSLESSQGAILTKLSDQVRRLDATVSELQKVQARLEETIDKTKETFADVTGAANKLASDTKGKLNTLTSEFNQVRDKVKLAGDAVTVLLELDSWGALFSRAPDGRLAQRPFGGAGADNGVNFINK